MAEKTNGTTTQEVKHTTTSVTVAGKTVNRVVGTKVQDGKIVPEDTQGDGVRQ